MEKLTSEALSKLIEDAEKGDAGARVIALSWLPRLCEEDADRLRLSLAKSPRR